MLTANSTGRQMGWTGTANLNAGHEIPTFWGENPDLSRDGLAVP